MSDRELLIICPRCDGWGIPPNGLGFLIDRVAPCPACKGTGLVEREAA